VRTFADLRLADPGNSLPAERAYKLVVMASDVSRGRLVRLPWDYGRYRRRPPRWPTFGIKLSARPDANQVIHRIEGTVGLTRAMIATMTGFHDQMHIDDPSVLARTIRQVCPSPRAEPARSMVDWSLLMAEVVACRIDNPARRAPRLGRPGAVAPVPRPLRC